MPHILPDKISETMTKLCHGGDHSKRSIFYVLQNVFLFAYGSAVVCMYAFFATTFVPL